MEIIEIKDINDGRLDIYYRNSENQLHNSNKYGLGYFICESELIINRAIEEGYMPISFLVRENDINKYNDIFNKYKDAVIYKVSEDIFKQLKGYILIRGILACFKRRQEIPIENIINNAKRIVVLEDVVNPTNVGAIFRNAAGLFADAVLLTTKSADPLYRRSIRTSMGNVFKIDWAYINDENYIDILHNYGFKIVSFALRNNSVNIDDEKLNNEDKLAIVLGSEGYGLNENTINNSDYVCKIEMNENVDSLNVASASGIALWQLCKENKKAKNE